MPKSVAVVLSLVAVIIGVVAQPARAQEIAYSQQPIVGAFHFNKRMDAISAEDRSVISTLSMATENGSDRIAFLMWSCRSNGLNVMYGFGTDMGRVNDEVIVRYRFADTPATEWERWDLGTGYQQVFMPLADVTEFTHQARSFRTVAVRVRDLEGEVTDVFRLDSLTEALRVMPCYRPSGSTR